MSQNGLFGPPAVNFGNHGNPESQEILQLYQLGAHAIDRGLSFDHGQNAPQHRHDAELVAHHRSYAHRRLHGAQDRNGYALARGEQRRIAHAVNHNSIDALTLRFDDAGCGCWLRQHDLEVAFDRSGTRVDIHKVDCNALRLKTDCVLGRAESLGRDRGYDADMDGHGGPRPNGERNHDTIGSKGSAENRNSCEPPERALDFVGRACELFQHSAEFSANLRRSC